MGKRSRLRRFLKIGFILAVLLPIAGFGLSNLYLMSPKCRAFLAGKITQRTGLEASIEGATWAPWSGITLYGIIVEQPTPLREQITAPLLLVESVRISPIWRALKNRRLSIKSVEIRKPELSIPIELLSQLPSQEQAPQIALNTPNSSAPAPQNQTPPVAVPLDDSKNTQPGEAEPRPQTVGAPPEPVIKPVSEQELPTTWVNFSDARIKVLSTFTRTSLYEASGIQGSLPIGGKSAESMIKIGPIKCLGNLLSENLEIPIHSQGTLLSTDTIETNFSDIDCKFGAGVRLVRGLPFQISASIPEQNDKKLELPPAPVFQIGNIGGQGRFQGLLTSPITWQGRWVIEALSISGEYETTKFQFDHGQALVIYGNGALRCLDARMIGDSTSLLGNATLLTDGRLAAVARVVSLPEQLVAISKFLRPDHSAPHLTPLNTPQRAALDLQLFGTPWNLLYMPDPRSDAIPLTNIISLD